VIGDGGVQCEHQYRRRRIEYQVELARPYRPLHRDHEQGQKQQGHQSSRPHAAPGQRNIDQQITPPVLCHFLLHQLPNQGVDLAVPLNQCVTLSASVMKEAAGRVEHESMH